MVSLKRVYLSLSVFMFVQTKVKYCHSGVNNFFKLKYLLVLTNAGVQKIVDLTSRSNQRNVCPASLCSTVPFSLIHSHSLFLQDLMEAGQLKDSVSVCCRVGFNQFKPIANS